MFGFRHGKGLAARTVALKVRFNTFHTVGRRRTLAHPVSATRPVHEAAAGLLDELGIGARWVRLVGVSVSNLTHNAFQLTLDEGWREVAKKGYKALPKEAKKYLEFVSKAMEVPIYIVSVGPGREETIVLKNVFGKK